MNREMHPTSQFEANREIIDSERLARIKELLGTRNAKETELLGLLRRGESGRDLAAVWSDLQVIQADCDLLLSNTLEGRISSTTRDQSLL